MINELNHVTTCSDRPELRDPIEPLSHLTILMVSPFRGSRKLSELFQGEGLDLPSFKFSAPARLLLMTGIYIPYAVYLYLTTVRPPHKNYTFSWAVFVLFHSHFGQVRSLLPT
ncbi:hypothetical protein J437_LFUL010449 [Ladona fulva]|uniref:Uncharacterized protein n=1 Tax=Ladona fulva TaxID=123851 RepID=A0A8K0P3M2_LADFU|nr:hypothetical protein J437_LFUL010449 [Ladona fulva]